MLADYASQDSDGKLGLLGAAWSHTSSPTPPQAVAVIVEVPGEQANVQFALEMELKDQHGQPFTIPNPVTGEASPLRVAQNLVAIALPGAPRHVHAVVPFIINAAPGMPLVPDMVYTWSATIDGDRDRSAAASFYVRPVPGGPVIG